MEKAAYEAFTAELVGNLGDRSDVLGLVAVGSMADGPDVWSDHDFLVIADPGAAEALRTHLTWLPAHERIVLSFRETAHGVKAVYDDKGRRSLVPTGEPEQSFECDDVLVAVGQENAFPWIERDSGIEFDKWGLPVLDKATFQSSVKNVFFRSPGVISASFFPSSPRGSVAMPGLAKVSFAACSWMALTTFGCWCPTFVFTSCDAKSR